MVDDLILNENPREYKLRVTARSSSDWKRITDLAKKVREYLIEKYTDEDGVYATIEDHNNIRWFIIRFDTTEDAFMFDLVFANEITRTYRYG